MLAKTPLRFIRVRHLELRSYCPAKKKTLKEKIAGSNQFCPSCFLPLVVAFIFIFTVSQLIVIHRTIEAYKLRNQAYENCYFPLTNTNDSRTLRDLSFSQNFIPSWHSPIPKDLRNAQEQSYPYNLHQKRYLEHNWNPSCTETPELRESSHTFCFFSSLFFVRRHLGHSPQARSKYLSSLVLAGGNMSINFHKDLALRTIATENPQVSRGGKWAPECNARFRVALIIPFRDRYGNFPVYRQTSL
ncbi:unnamed protein product [Allacma fusca]|uniref:Galactosyltransferase N-terminal domain-containing protein n=1 Tax=Allacma fusca TaxID=39272 RepID=A0A8J2P2D9_9HEXA|nr:unnamed protein product [Allacma fusca]